MALDVEIGFESPQFRLCAGADFPALPRMLDAHLSADTSLAGAAARRALPAPAAAAQYLPADARISPLSGPHIEDVTEVSRPSCFHPLGLGPNFV